jgi:calmodulin-regulated spectrin-associated protein
LPLEFVTLKPFIVSTVNRSPSATNIYRHHTPPKELPPYTPHNNGNGTPDRDFVVHKSKGITTLFNMQEALMPAKLRQAKEKTNNDSKADERGKRLRIGPAA